MSPLVLRFAEHIHGHLGWLSTLALYHPAILLRRHHRRGLVAATLATALATLTAALGVGLYPSYRTLVKPVVFRASSALGNAFERKEHLAIAIVILSWAGLVAHFAADRERQAIPELSRVAFVAYASAAALATLTACLGLAVAAHFGF